MTKDPPAQSRPLGIYETLLASIAERLDGASQMTTALRLHGPLTEDLLRHALGHLQARHPTLRAVLENDAGDYRIRADDRRDKVPLTVLDHGTDWREVFDADLNRPLDATESLWRATLLSASADPERHDLIITNHHVAADGISIAKFAEELLDVLATLARGETPKLEPLPLTAPIETLRREQPALDDFMAGLAAYLAAQPALTPWPFARAAPIAERTCKALHRHCDPDLVERLHLRAHSESTTVTAALGAAMLIAAARRRESPLTASLESVFDLRGHCEPVMDDAVMGCYLTSFQVGLADIEANGDFWHLARTYRAAYQDGVTQAGYFPPDFDLTPILALTERSKVDAMTAFGFGLGLSNLGHYRGREVHGPFTLERLSFGAARPAGFFAGFLHTVSLETGLNLSFCYAEPLLETAWAETYMDEVLALLAQSAA